MSKILKRSTKKLAMVGAAAALMLVPAGVANAQTAGSQKTYPVVKVHHASQASRTAAAANASCTTPITEYGYTGQRVCGFAYTEIDWSDGDVEWFIVGGDYAIWHIWNGSGGWQSLGGQASSIAPNGVYPYSNSEAIIDTVGTDGYLWCDAWGVPWSGWHKC